MATTYYSTADLDALLKQSLSKTSDLDALLKQPQTKDLSLDSLLKAAQTKGLDLDANLTGSVRLPRAFNAFAYAGQVGSVAPGQYIIGNTSNALGLVLWVVDDGATGIIYYTSLVGTFIDTETVYVGILGSELITNGDMELDANWAKYGTDQSSLTRTWSTTREHSGTHSQYIYDSSLPTTPVGIQSDAFITTANNFYIVDFWINADYSDGFRIVMNSGAGVFGHPFEYATPSPLDTWLNYNFTYQETLGGGSKARFIFLQPDGLTGTWRYYLDDVSIKEITPSGSNYFTVNGDPYNPTPHLDALLLKPQTKSLSLDALLGLTISLADPAYLSEMRCEATFGVRSGVDAKLSAMEIESRFGARAKDPLNLSALECEATILAPYQITLDSKLSVLGAESRFGLRCKDDLKFAALGIEADISGGGGFSIDKFFAPIEAEILISTPGQINVDKSFSALQAEISVSREQSISLDKSLSALAIEAAIGTNAIDLDSKLSALGIEAEISNREIAVDAKLSALAIESQINNYQISLDSKLSALGIVADIGSRGFNLDSKLSALAIEATIDDFSMSVDSNLSALGIEASISENAISIDSRLSALAVDASINNREISLDSNLSALGIEAVIENFGIAVDSNLSAVEISSTIIPEADTSFIIDSKIAPIESDIDISVQLGIEVDSNLSALGLVSTILFGDLISVDRKLSVMAIEANILWSNVPIIVDAYLSALTMAGVGTGEDSDGAVATMTESGRFDDYTLRHSRW